MDDHITCSDCGGTFVFTEAEREFYEARGLAVPPKRCKTCRQARKAARPDGPPSVRGAPSSRGGPRDRPRGDRSAGPPNRSFGGGPPRDRRPAPRAGKPWAPGGDRPRDRGPSSAGAPGGRDRPRPPPPARESPGAPEAAPKVRPERPKFEIACVTCGTKAMVPFKPIEGRDVFCQPCYRARPRPAQAAEASPPDSTDEGSVD